MTAVTRARLLEIAARLSQLGEDQQSAELAHHAATIREIVGDIKQTQ